jgi:hypothetical protein
VRPDPGKLILFPSYFYHGTIPFEDHRYRTTIAFDVVPGMKSASDKLAYATF